MNKLYDKITWHNDTTPALNETNLNKMSKAIDDIDDRVVLLADDVFEQIPQIQAYLEQAEDLVEALELMTANPPYIGANGHWYTWDTSQEAYVDSGIDASITVQIADVTAIAPDATPYVTNTGTDTDPVFHLFIPRGQTGAPGADGISPAVTITTITGGHRVNITDADHPSGQNFDVMDGHDGASDWADITNKPNFATVATSGSYNDLSNKPSIPAAQVNSDWNAASGVAQILNKPTIPSITNCYQTTDTEETALANADYVPFYDISASAKRKISWSNIKSVLKTYFDTLYTKTVANPTGTATGTLTKLGIGSDIYEIQGGSGADKADTTLIAPVQSTLTASKAYAVGEQFVYNQVLYKVTQAIASGATITIGTNCELAGSVTEQLYNKLCKVDIVATSTTGNYTYGQILEQLMTAFNALSQEEKANAVVIRDLQYGDNSNYFYLQSIGGAMFGNLYIGGFTSTPYISIQMISLANAKWYSAAFKNGNIMEFSDNTNLSIGANTQWALGVFR